MKTWITAVLVVVGLSSVARPAWAQRDAGSKIRGDAYEIWSGGNYNDHAYDHAQLLNRYSAAGATVPAPVIEEHASAIRSNVESSKRSYSRVSEAAQKNPAVAKLVASINAHGQRATQLCVMLDKEAMEDGDSATVMKHCAEAEKELKAAADEHEQLLKLLNVPPFKK